MTAPIDPLVPPPHGADTPPARAGGDHVLVPRLIVLAVVGCLLFVPPLLRLWEGSATALFAVWAALIAVLAWLMERRPR